MTHAYDAERWREAGVVPPFSFPSTTFQPDCYVNVHIGGPDWGKSIAVGDFTRLVSITVGEPGFLPAYGLVVGLLVGLTGMGGGVLMMPLLLLGVGMPASAAVATDLLYSAPTKIVGGWQHWRQGTVNRRVMRDLATGSLPGSLLAVAVLATLQSGGETLSDVWLERGIGVVMLVAAGLMVHRIARRLWGVEHPATTSSWMDRSYRRGWIITVGAIGGFLVGLTSIGSGSLIIALLVMVVSLEPTKLVGTDIAHAALLVTTAAIAHLFLGHADVGVAAWLLTGSIPGVLIGSRLAIHAPRMMLQSILVVLLLSTSVRLL